MSTGAENHGESITWSLGDAPLGGTGVVAALGNFDGVHRGHKKVIESALRAAGRMSLAPAVVTFDPHPREFFRQDDVAFRLADRREKDRLIGALGVARIIHVTFDDALRRTDAKSFVTDILPALGVRHLFAGTDFAFGRGRGGDIDTINAIGGEMEGARRVEARAVPLLCDANSAVISSTRIRAALQAGDPAQASDMLGHDWAITGVVQKGDRRGRTIGFPTANVRLGALLNPAFGVYAVQVFDAEPGKGFAPIGNGVANVGVRPTVEDRGVLCEAHLFDASLDLYGRRIAVCLNAFVRPERKFAGIEALTAQIASDVEAARAVLPPHRQTA